MKMLWGKDKKEMNERHILFQEEDQDTYIKSMLETALTTHVQSAGML